MQSWLISLAWLFATGASAADNCESLRSEIEARIRAAGVASFSLSVLDARAPTAAKTVGSCAMGQRKIVYTPLAGPSPAGAPPSASAMLTECRDGSTPSDGRCSR